VRGVPCVVIDEKHALPGAQPVKAIGNPRRQAWSEAHPLKTSQLPATPTVSAKAMTASCRPEGGNMFMTLD
jgi:hypothetical protein